MLFLLVAVLPVVLTQAAEICRRRRDHAERRLERAAEARVAALEARVAALETWIKEKR